MSKYQTGMDVKDRVRIKRPEYNSGFQDPAYRYARSHVDSTQGPPTSGLKKAMIAGLASAIIGAAGLLYSCSDDIDKKLESAKPPAYRSLTNGSLVLHKMTEWEAKNPRPLFERCGKKLGMETSELEEMVGNAHLETFGKPFYREELKKGDKIPFPPECE